MSSIQVEKVNLILTKIVEWATNRKDISALVLVGSWSRGTARFDSDIDLCFLTPNPSGFRDSETWIEEIDWEAIGCKVGDWEDKDYGLVWSRHIYLEDKTEIEFGFSMPSWASIDPIDEGTFRVISDGCRILYDPENTLARLIDAVIHN
jgi:uncharacterized protein